MKLAKQFLGPVNMLWLWGCLKNTIKTWFSTETSLSTKPRAGTVYTQLRSRNLRGREKVSGARKKETREALWKSRFLQLLSFKREQIIFSFWKQMEMSTFRKATLEDKREVLRTPERINPSPLPSSTLISIRGRKDADIPYYDVSILKFKPGMVTMT